MLNLQNGALDLRTGKLNPHDPGRFITKLAGNYYDPTAQCLTWAAFLSRDLVDKNVIDFVRRAIGYSLTGSVGEQVLFFLHGSGANGKSVFFRAILDILGDYGKQAAPQMLMSGDRRPTEVADLHGARFVATVEVEEGRPLAEVLVKQITGGDRITARFMRRDFFSFDPTHKIWLAANHKPIIRGTDHGIWRRIRMVPFEVTIPASEQDPTLSDKLRSELPGILAWAVRGCLEWQQTGLAAPEKILRATEAYQAEMDFITGYLDERCVVNSRASVTAGNLYSDVRNWAELSGEKLISHRAFSTRMKERGFATSSRDGSGRAVYFGLGLLTKDGDNDSKI